VLHWLGSCRLLPRLSPAAAVLLLASEDSTTRFAAHQPPVHYCLTGCGTSPGWHDTAAGCCCCCGLLLLGGVCTGVQVCLQLQLLLMSNPASGTPKHAASRNVSSAASTKHPLLHSAAAAAAAAAAGGLSLPAANSWTQSWQEGLKRNSSLLPKCPAVA
jgi:hypothetical protein